MRRMELFVFLIILAIIAFGIAFVYMAFSALLNLIGIPVPFGIDAFPAVFWGSFIFLVMVTGYQKVFGH
jgi:hypothetical protein